MFFFSHGDSSFHHRCTILKCLLVHAKELRASDQCQYMFTTETCIVYALVFIIIFLRPDQGFRLHLICLLSPFPHLLSFSQMIYVMQSQLKRYIGYFIMERNAIPYKDYYYCIEVMMEKDQCSARFQCICILSRTP